MTLIISEISKFGIAMVADSAATFEYKLPSGKKVPQVLYGLRKLQPIPYLNAGISMWGLGEIESTPTDVWLNDFIIRNSHIDSIDDFANELARELQRKVGKLEIELGFHLAGYVQLNGEMLPTFYHIRNVEGNYRDGYTYDNFSTGHDFPPQQIGDRLKITRNGDYGPYAILVMLSKMALSEIEKDLKLTIPNPSLQGRIAFHAAWVRFVSELYASSGLPKTIGGPVSAIGITPEGKFTNMLNL
jgi:hypothetical protein